MPHLRRQNIAFAAASKKNSRLIIFPEIFEIVAIKAVFAGSWFFRENSYLSLIVILLSSLKASIFELKTL
jgi:hypothetical protein